MLSFIYTFIRDLFSWRKRTSDRVLEIQKLDRSIWDLNQKLRRDEQVVLQEMGRAADAMAEELEQTDKADDTLANQLLFHELYNSFWSRINDLRMKADHDRALLLIDRKKLVGREITEHEFIRLTDDRLDVPASHVGWYPPVRG